MTTISRDRIQFEDLANRVNDGNEQDHTKAAAAAWAAGATDFLEANGGGCATVGNGKDLRVFQFTGDPDIAAEADRAGWTDAREYIESACQASFDDDEPDVVCADGTTLKYSEARSAWEDGSLSDWIEEHGLPVTVGDEQIERLIDIEDAFSDSSWD